MKAKYAIIILLFSTFTFPIGSYLLGWIHGQRLGLSVGSTIGSNVALKNARLIRENRNQDALRSLEQYGLARGPVAFPSQSFLPSKDEIENFALPSSISVEKANASSLEIYRSYIANYPERATAGE